MSQKEVDSVRFRSNRGFKETSAELPVKSNNKFSKTRGQKIKERFLTVFCSVCIIIFGIASLTHATPGSVVTSIGENISTNSLSLTGAITSGSWLGDIIDIAHGGTGQNWLTAIKGSIPFFSDTGTMSTLNPGNAGQVLQSGGAGANPSWASIPSATTINVSTYGAVNDGTTDNTTAFNNAINAAINAGGGIISIPAGTYLINGQIILPNDGATPPKQKPIRFIGAGASMSGRGTGANGGTVLDMRYSLGIYGKLVTSGLGLLEIEGVTFADAGEDALPWIYTTNTTLQIRNCAFIGSKTGTACNQDAIILGGTTEVEGHGGLDDGFQGYGTVIDSNYFDGIRRAVYGRVFANAVVVSNNNIWAHSGSNLANGAAIDFDDVAAGASQHVVGNIISNNLVEMYGYPYAIRLGRAEQNSIITNNFYDAADVTIAGVLFDTDSNYNYLLNGFYGDKPAFIDNSTNQVNTVDDRQRGYGILTKNQYGLNFSASGILHTYQIYAGYPGQYNGDLVFQQDMTTPLGAVRYDGNFVWGGANPDNPNVMLGSSGYITLQNGSVGWYTGTGSPEGVVTAKIGSFYSRQDGGANSAFYVKESGAGNIGWVAK